MSYDPHKHHRRSIRLPGYDYAQAGAYFVTLVTHDRACLFGDIVDGEMRLNEAGQIAERCWLDIPAHFPHVALDMFVIMPNHVHGIVWIMETPAGAMGPGEMAGNARPGEMGVGAKNFSPLSPPSTSSPLSPPSTSSPLSPPSTSSPLPPSSASSPLPPSSASSPPRPPTTQARSGDPPTNAGLPHGTSRTIGSVVRGFKIGVTKWFRQNTSLDVVWQRNYYEHIIRDEPSLRRIREYIITNPQRWNLDDENPAVSGGR